MVDGGNGNRYSQILYRDVWWISRDKRFGLAASLCFGIIKNHPFCDGNKRTGLLASRSFLFRNGYIFEPLEIDEIRIIRGVADGKIDELELEEWFEQYSVKRDNLFTQLRVF
jgi:death-on-curing family protein